MRRKTKSRLTAALAVLLIIAVLMPAVPVQASTNEALNSISSTTAFNSNPQTPYAAQFIRLSEGQLWFLDAIEAILNIHAMSINTVSSRADLDTVITLGLFSTGVTGSIPPAIGELRNLQFLFLGQNNLYGSIPAELFSNANLREIDLSQNNLSGTIPAGFGSLPNLRALFLWGNQFTGPIPAELGGLTRLENLDLSSNDLTGGIPAALGNATALRALNLSDNNLGGAIPESIGNLPNLRIFAAWNAGLTGNLPEHLGNLSNLEILDLSQNSFTGTIPASFANMARLRQLSLADNSLSGRVPAVLADMTPLEILDISHNSFVGDTLVSLAALNVADVSHNYLYGENVAGLTYNTGNFIHQQGNGAQYRLHMPPYTQTAVNNRFNVYSAFQIRHADTDAVAAKPKLPVSSYEVVAFGHPPSADDAFEITSDANGIYIRLLREIAHADALWFELRMLPHDGDSIYSFTRFSIGTAAGQTTPPPMPIPPTVPPTEDTADEGTTNEGTTVGGGASVPPASAPPSILPPQQAPSIAPELQRAYIDGISDLLFRPDVPMWRDHIAQALHNIAGNPTAQSVHPFNDIVSNHPANAAIAWVFETELMIGYPDGTFRPDGNLTRAEFVTIVARMMGYEPMATESFSDVHGHWASGFIGVVQHYGHVQGYPDGTFRPDAPITRAEVVTVLNSIIGRAADMEIARELANPFVDVTDRHWAFAEILVAAVEHYQ